MSFLARSLRLLAPRLNVTRVTVSRTFAKPVGGDEEYEKAYKLFDADGDGDLSPEEFSRILTSIGETPGDLNMFFSGMTSETFTDFKPCVDFISFMIKHVNKSANPKTAEAELVASMAEFGTNSHNMTSDGLFEWIDSEYPEMSEEEIEHLVDGADIDGDGNVNFVAYANIVCEKILNLSSAALQDAFETIDTDKSGDISSEELSRFSLEDQLAKIDFDNSGTISFVEFLFAIFRSKGESYLMDSFRQYDQNNSGFISPEELTSFFAAHGASVDNVDTLIKGADFNGDGKIDYNEFIAMVVKREL